MLMMGVTKYEMLYFFQVLCLLIVVYSKIYRKILSGASEVGSPSDHLGSRQ